MQIGRNQYQILEACGVKPYIWQSCWSGLETVSDALVEKGGCARAVGTVKEQQVMMHNSTEFRHRLYSGSGFAWQQLRTSAKDDSGEVAQLLCLPSSCASIRCRAALKTRDTNGLVFGGQYARPLLLEWAIAMKGMFSMFQHRNLDASQPLGSRDPAPPLLSPAQAQLSFGSGLLTLFTRRAVVKTHLTRNRQLLTGGPKYVPPPSQGSRICDHYIFIITPTDKET
jgi:hypothetical protein